MKFRILKMLKKYNVSYEVVEKLDPDYRGILVKKRLAIITKDMVQELIDKMSENNFANIRGYNNERVKRESIIKLRKFKETL